MGRDRRKFVMVAFSSNEGAAVGREEAGDMQHEGAGLGGRQS